MYKALAGLVWCCCAFCAYPQRVPTALDGEIETQIAEWMDEGDIPGLAIVYIQGDRQTIRSFGYADLCKETRVSPETLFELGSCSKAFTALAITLLEQEGKLSLDDEVTDYIPWLSMQYEDTLVHVTLGQLLHHTSGVPWNTLAKIPVTGAPDALEQTVRQLVGQELKHLPGTQYEYATINYDVLALVIQKVVHRPFEAYMQDAIFKPLALDHTTIGAPLDSVLLATGYKIGFFVPRPYRSPAFRGNNAAGYIISNAEDIGAWLRFQMGLSHHELSPLLAFTHQRDEGVQLHGAYSYARGWDVALDGTREINHSGLNPNYSTYITFRKEEKIGVAILANSNSSFTPFIGNKIMKLLAAEKIEKAHDPDGGTDKIFSLLSLILAAYALVVVAFMTFMAVEIHQRKRTFQGLTFRRFFKFMLAVVVVLPFFYGIYLLPQAMAGFTWQAIVVWAPLSFTVMIELLLGAIGISYFAYLISLLFPDENKFRRNAPQILLMSVISGLSNMVVIVMVTSAFDNPTEVRYLVLYYTLVLLIYLLGRRFVQTSLIRLTSALIYELRVKLIDKIYATSYQKFEKIDRGRVYTALNDDVGTIGEFANMFVILATNIITTVGAFLFLASIALWATILVIVVVVSISLVYYFVGKSTNVYLERARDSRTVFMGFLSGMIDGFKEISLHINKKLEYKKHMAASADEYRRKSSFADIRLVNAFLVGESLLLILLGMVSFGIPEFFPNIKPYTVMSFVIVLLYLIGPLNGILGSVPGILRLKVAWERVQQFLKEIPANLDLDNTPNPVVPEVHSLHAVGIKYKYKAENSRDVFEVGPLDLEVKRGQIVFIVGGNGSGKTTLAKLLTGLYEPDEGVIMINDKVVKGSQLSECFSTVFSPAYLFERLYNIDLSYKQDVVDKYLKLLNLEDKVEITENKYSTIQLSGGQRKRLALLQCYMEDSPIYLFDEWAADQDPGYRNFFYRTLLPEMKKAGKIVIAITHDDHYFDAADKVLVMKQGKLEIYYPEYSLSGAS